MAHTPLKYPRWLVATAIASSAFAHAGCGDTPTTNTDAPTAVPTASPPDTSPNGSSPDPAVRIAQIERTASSDVEVILSKDDGFYVGASRPALRIGDRVFALSRHPANGDLKTLIFPIPQKALLGIDDKEPIYFASREADLFLDRSLELLAQSQPASRGTWFLGRLDKSTLETAPAREGDNR